MSNTPLSPVGGFAAGALAACGAVTVTNPMEVVKTRLQLQGELAAKGQVKKIYTGVFQALRIIAINEGIRGTQRGLGVAYCYQICLNGCRLGFYEPIRSRLAKMTFGTPDKSSVAINMVSGASSGIMGACLGSPFFLVKTRLQSYSPVFPVGTQHVYNGAMDAFRHIWKEGGLRGLYRGLDAAAIRTGMGSSVQLPVYNWAKKTIEKYNLITDGPMKHIAASACSGVGVCIAMHPADTVMTRMYNQRGAAKEGPIPESPSVDISKKAGGKLYKNPLDCLIQTVRTEGPLAVYKGFFAHLLRIAPHTILTLTFMEQTNKLFLKIEGKA